MPDETKTTSTVATEQPPAAKAPAVSDEKSKEAPVVPAKGAATDTKGAGKEESKTKGRTFTEEDWNKRQSSWDKQTAALQAKVKELSDAHALVQAQLEEERDRKYLAGIEEKGGDIDAAKQLLADRRAVTAKERTIAAQLAQISAREAELNIAAKGKSAHDLITQYQLGAEVVDALMECETLPDMKAKALELYVEKLKTDKTPEQKIDSNTGGPAPEDWSKLSDAAKLAKAMELTRRK